MLHLQECLRLFSASLKLLLHEGKCPQDMHRRRRTWALTSCSHGRFWVTKILQKCDTEEEVSLGMGWNSLWSVFLFLPLSVLMVPEYELFAKIRFKDGRGLPWWRSGWESASNAGDMGSSPGLGGSHMPRSNWAREPQLLSLRVWRLCSATREAAIVRGPRTAMKSGPRLPQLEKALAQKRRPNTAKNK